MIHFALLEDDTRLKESVVQYFESSEKVRCVIAVNTVKKMVKYYKSSSVAIDVMLIDIGLPEMSGIEGLPMLKKHFPDTQLLIFTANKDYNLVFKAMCLGAHGYLLKNLTLHQLEENILLSAAGDAAISPQIARRMIEYFHPKSSDDSNLTTKEEQIILLLNDGKQYKMISELLGISVDGVRFHIKNIYKKLHINSRSELASMKLKGEI